MKTFITMKGFYDGIRARRLEVFGRLELLRVLEEPPYWFIRLNGHWRPYDGKYWDNKDTRLCWRFTSLEAAKANFAQLCSWPEYIQEAQEARKLSELKRQRVLENVASGKLKPFKPVTDAENPRVRPFPTPL